MMATLSKESVSRELISLESVHARTGQTGSRSRLRDLFEVVPFHLLKRLVLEVVDRGAMAGSFTSQNEADRHCP